MSRMWLQRLLSVIAILAAAALAVAPARAQSVIPGPETGFFQTPLLTPPPDFPYYQRPKPIPVDWPLIPERFCSQAEKDAFLADLARKVQLAQANFDLADEFRSSFERGMLEAAKERASASYRATLAAEYEQLSILRNHQLQVLSAWNRIAARLKAMPVSNCPKDQFGPPPLPVPAPLPPPPSSITPEGYFTGPITASMPPEPGPDLRPTFAPIDFPPVATAFCSAAQKAAYLQQVAGLVALADLNHQLAYYYRYNAGERARLYAEAGQTTEAARWEAEYAAYGPIVDYHREVLDTWRSIQQRVSALPVIDCDKPLDSPRPPPAVDLPESAPPAPSGFVQPSKDPDGNPHDLPDIPERFCSVAERSAYLANTFDPMVRAAQQAAEDAYRALEALKAKGASRAQLDQAQISWTARSTRAQMLLYLRADVLKMPIVDCERPDAPGRIVPEEFVQPSRDIRGNPLNLPDIPEKFCSEAERAAYLLASFDPRLAAEVAKAQAARQRYDELQALYDKAVKEAGNAPFDPRALEVYGQLSAAAFELSIHEDRVKALHALREQVLRQPIVKCDPEDGFAGPDSVPAAPVPPAQAAAALPPQALLDLPASFCSEAERLAYLTDVYHPLAEAASRAAVEAYRKLDQLHKDLEKAEREKTDAFLPAYLREEIRRQRLEAQELAERARRLIALRETILRIPIVPCPKDEDGPSEDRPVVSDARPPAIAAPDVRPATLLEEQVLAEINLLRSDPAAYANLLPGVIRGARPADVQAAVQALQAASPAPPLAFNESLAGAAISHADDIGPAGTTGHTGTDGSTLGGRIREFGLIATLTAEELSYGQGSARAVVVQFVIDAGVAGAPHRRDLLNPVFRMAGVGCGPHKTYGKMCVITLSGPPFQPSG